MATGPALRHGREIDRRWGRRIRGGAATVVRRVRGKRVWSQHSFGNATDRYGTRSDMAALAAWSVATASVWSVATVIYNRRIWSSRTRRWSTYFGDNPHTNHVHIDYLPRWTGTPPGRPLGTPAAEIRKYPDIPRGNRGLGLAVTSRTTWGSLERLSLRRGSRGFVVEALQVVLRLGGFLGTSDIDGAYGPRTESAVLRMQSIARVSVTGRVGGPDWRALYWGPAAWAKSDIADVGGAGWLAPPVVTPVGELEHSWESTLNALDPLVKGAAGATSWYARAIRSVTS